MAEFTLKCIRKYDTSFSITVVLSANKILREA